MTPANDDRLLATRAARGDSQAFAELVHRHQQAIFNVAYRLLGNVQDAEDAVQETFLRVYRFFGRFDVNRPFAPWVKRIAVNVCLNRMTNRPAPRSLDADDAPPAPDPSPGPEVHTIQRDLGRRVWDEILALPPRYRAVIELRHFQGLSYAEIAEALNLPLNTVKSDLFRARKLLATRLRDLRENR